MPTKFKRFRCSVCSVKKVPYKLIQLPFEGEGNRVLLCWPCSKRAFDKLARIDLSRPNTLKEFKDSKGVTVKRVSVEIRNPYNNMR